jgi:hypothetical protein
MFCFGNATTSRYAPNKIIDQNSVLQFFSKSFGFPTFRIWAYMMKVIPETHRAQYLRFYYV